LWPAESVAEESSASAARAVTIPRSAIVACEGALSDGGLGGFGERALEAAGGVEVVAGPDHPHGGGGGLAVFAAEVVADGGEEPLGCEPVVVQRLR
jgi:hypothetical protein